MAQRRAIQDQDAVGGGGWRGLPAQRSHPSWWQREPAANPTCRANTMCTEDRGGRERGEAGEGRGEEEEGQEEEEKQE